MKKMLYAFLLISGVACSKDDHLDLLGKFVMQSGGVTYDFNGTYDQLSTKGSIIGRSYGVTDVINFFANDLNTDQWFSTRLRTPALQAITYNVAMELRINGKNYEGDSSRCQVTFTSVANGRANGSFSGELLLAHPNPPAPITVTGQFQDVKMNL